MSSPFTNKPFSQITCPALGIKALERHVDHETLVYLLRSMYRIVLLSKELKENKRQFQRRIARFEKQSDIPGFLSALPTQQLLLELEDAQYLYPICRREVVLPTFH